MSDDVDYRAAGDDTIRHFCRHRCLLRRMDAESDRNRNICFFPDDLNDIFQSLSELASHAGHSHGRDDIDETGCHLSQAADPFF